MNKAGNGVLKYLDGWRYYRLGRDEYRKCMETAFAGNIYALSWATLLFFVLAAVFSVFPIVTEDNFVKTYYYLGAAGAALFLSVFSRYKAWQYGSGKQISRKLVYALIILYFVNVMSFGFYLAVWAEPEKISGSFIGIFICVLIVFNIPPALYLFLKLGMLAVYIAMVVLFKAPSVWNYDIQNALFSFIISLIYGWQISMNRITMMSAADRLKDENTTDPLTQLKNRRDFMETFQRFITNYRHTDNFLCAALLDIDCFKAYNDHYGHPQGDECLRAIGKALNNLHKDRGIYAARVGGEEFALLWHVGNSSDAEEAGAHIIRLITDLNIPHEKSPVAPYITVSIGIHIAECGIPHDIKDLYNLADKALYAAKGKGRNCLVVSGA